MRSVRGIIHHILIVLLLLLVSIPLCAQDIDLDKQLNRYELLCMRCLELRLRTNLEGTVPKQEAQSLINSFLNQNKILKAAESQMSPAQRRRFSAIGSWFSTGRVEPLSDINEVPHLKDIPSPQYLDIEDHRIEPQVAEPKKVSLSDVYVLASISAPDLSYGLMIGYKYGRKGGYARFVSNYHSCPTSYYCDSEGYLSNGQQFWASGESVVCNLSASVGPMFSLGYGLDVYAGLGYGFRKVAWEDMGGSWAAVKDFSLAGLTMECGAVYSWESLVLSLGVQTLKFRTTSLVCGVGVVF